MISKKHVDNRFEVNVFFNVHLRAMELLHLACPRVLQDFGATSLQAHLRCGKLGLRDVASSWHSGCIGAGPRTCRGVAPIRCKLRT